MGNHPFFQWYLSSAALRRELDMSARPSSFQLNLTRSNYWTPTVYSAQSFADQLAGWLASSGRPPAWPANCQSQLHLQRGWCSLHVNDGMVLLDGQRVWWWQRWSELFSFISYAHHLGNSHCHWLVVVYGCGYLNSSAIYSYRIMWNY